MATYSSGRRRVVIALALTSLFLLTLDCFFAFFYCFYMFLLPFLLFLPFLTSPAGEVSD